MTCSEFGLNIFYSVIDVINADFEQVIIYIFLGIQ